MLRFVVTMLLASGVSVVNAPSSAFEGSWVDDLGTQNLAPHVDIYSLKGGIYSCRSCSPPRVYPADGAIHGVKGDPDVISESMIALNEREVRTVLREPTMTRTTTYIVSPDNATLTYISDDVRHGVRGPLRTVYLAKRVAPNMPGEHRLSGSWQGIRYLEVPEEYRTTNIHLEGATFTLVRPTGARFTAVIGGSFVEPSGLHDAGLTVAMRESSPRVMIEEVQIAGKPVTRRTFTVSSNGGALETSTTNLERGETVHVTAHRVQAKSD